MADIAEPLAQLERAIRSRRLPRCAGCWLPRALCICADLPRLEVHTRLVVVMHRREAITSSNTGRLAVRCLAGATLRIRGDRADATPPAPRAAGRRLALFPSPGARALHPGDAEGEPPVLLVPDGSWTQAKKLLRRDPEIRAAEPVTLPLPLPPSRYSLRRRQREDGFCTLEAIAHALGLLESPAIEAALLATLDRFLTRAHQTRTSGAALPR